MQDSPPVPVANGYHLPVEAYTDATWFANEQRDLFDRTWQFVGMSDDFSRDGDYRTSDVGASGLIVMRGSGGTLTAFHNLCRHRGARLLEGSGNVGRELTCFYHSWAYGFDGALKRIPQSDQFDGLDIGCFGLHRGSVDTANGMVFVHSEPDPEPLATWLGDMPSAMGPYNPLVLGEVQRQTFDVHANWKLFAENHIDGYHLWHLHRTSVVGFDHAKQSWRPIGRHWTFQEPSKKPGVSPTATLGLPAIAGLPPQWQGSTVHLLFPNLGVASGGEYWLTLHMVPLAADLTRVEVRTRTMPLDRLAKTKIGAVEAFGAVRSILRHQAAVLSGSKTSGRRSLLEVGGDQITAEDRRAAESIQQAMKSPRFSVGAMARDYEGAISEFQRNIAAFVGVEQSSSLLRPQ